MKLSDKLARERTRNPDIERVQNNLQRFLKELDSNFLEIYARLISPGNWVRLYSVPLIIGANVITHDLGRVPVGWEITRVQVAHPAAFDTAFDETTLTLQSAAISTIDLLVY